MEGDNLMDDMQFARYSSDIREILDIIDEEGSMNLVRNVVKYISVENHNPTNWLAHELLIDVIPIDNIIQLFDE